MFYDKDKITGRREISFIYGIIIVANLECLECLLQVWHYAYYELWYVMKFSQPYQQAVQIPLLSPNLANKKTERV